MNNTNCSVHIVSEETETRNSNWMQLLGNSTYSIQTNKPIGN